MTVRMRWVAATFLGLMMVGSLGCASEETAWEGDAQRGVYVDNHAMQYMAQRIGGDAIEVHFPLPEGMDPSDWMPNDDAIAGYQQADMVLMSGAGYAPWRGHFSLPSANVVDTSAGFADRLVEYEGQMHSHGDGPAHRHTYTAAYTWLDPDLAIEHARAIKQALSERSPDEAAGFAQRFEALEQDLGELAEAMDEAFAELQGQTVLATEHVYHYLGARYDVAFQTVHLHGPGEVADMDIADAELMFWRIEPSARMLEALQERGVRSVVYRTGEREDQGEDWLEQMWANIEAVRGE